MGVGEWMIAGCERHENEQAERELRKERLTADLWSEFADDDLARFDWQDELAVAIRKDSRLAARIITNSANAEKHDELHAFYLQAIALDAIAVVRLMIERHVADELLFDRAPADHDVEQFEARR